MLYHALEALTAVATALFAGAVSVLVAERRDLPRRPYFLVGVGCGLAATFFGDLARVVVLCGGPAVALAVPAREADPIRRRISQADATWWLQVALLVFAGIVAYSLLGGGMESLKRSATAPAEIVDRYPTVLSGGNDKTPAIYGLVVRYEFTVAGVTYSGTARKRWSQTDGAKVCYDPDDPGGTHALEKSGYACGSFDPFRPEG